MNSTQIQPLVTCSGVTRTYGMGERATVALRGTDLDILPGELTLLVGPSGCGKTTLISIIAGILKPTSGDVEVAEENLVTMSERLKAAFRAETVGIVFQHFHLIPTLTAAENVAVPLIINRCSPRRAISLARDLLAELGLGDRSGAFPGELSGGEQQRLSIARAIIHEPRIVVCDEPTSALDQQTGRQVMQLLRRHAVQHDRALLVVTHDQRIFEFADRVVHLEDGRIVGDERLQSQPVKKLHSSAACYN
jgi:putative ABC transport system ATP-binding protein